MWNLHSRYYIGGSDRVDVQSYHLNIALAAAVGNAIAYSKVTARKCRELIRIPNLWETKKIEKTYAKENNHMHKKILTWFGNLPTFAEL